MRCGCATATDSHINRQYQFSALATGELPATPAQQGPDISRISRRWFTVGAMADHGNLTPGDVAAMTANPFYAITIDEGLALPHEPMISEDEWIKANVALLNELGPEPYLRTLLTVLKGNYPRG